MNDLEKYYNKFNEDKRLLSRHGQVEFFVATEYIQKYINGRKNLKILDIGAGTGRYSAFFAEQGHSVTAVELVKKNVSQIKEKNANIVVKQGNALNLKLEDNQFDITLLFGPMYHLQTKEQKVQALKEALRVTKKDGFVLVMYLMNDYAVITYAFKEGHLLESLKNNKLDTNFQTQLSEEDLYSYVRLDLINEINKQVPAKRIEIIGVDGPTDYIRPTINKMNDQEFGIYKNYVLSISQRPELLGASSHVLDILKK